MRQNDVKRKFNKKILAAILIIAVFFAWVIWTNVNIRLTSVTISNEKIPEAFDSFKIAHLSDFHNQKHGDKIIAMLKAENPDIIAVTGDLVDSYHTDFDLSADFIEQVTAIAPVYYVAGNHEGRLDNYSEFENLLAQAGVIVMNDEYTFIEKNGEVINLVGLQDPSFLKNTILPDMRESVIEGRLEWLLNDGLYNLVLCHRPELFEIYVRSHADLVLTGHAHGGQMRIPFIGGLIAPNQGLFPKYTSGVYSKDGTDMIVSRGLGNSIMRFRINNTPEVVIITLEAD